MGNAPSSPWHEAGLFVVVASLVGAATWYFSEPRTSQAGKRTLEADPGCVLQNPEDAQAPVPGFPTGVGFAAFEKAAQKGTTEAEQRALLREHHGHEIPPGTRCSWIDVGPEGSQARIVEGELEGVVLFFRTTWTGKKAR